MGERESHPPGAFSWVELVTSDAEAAKAFYGELFGWAFDDQPAGGSATYTMVSKDGREVAGLFADPQQPPHWNSYVTVESADAASSRAAELGATVVAPPFDVLDAGRMAVLQDPSGAYICVWEARRHPGARLVNTPGALTWNDLTTRDVDAARAFYTAWLGWELDDVPDSGGYAIVKNGGRSNGGIMAMPPQLGPEVPPSWTPYFGIDGLDAAIERIAALGGATLTGPMQMPGGRIAVLLDPQGAAFSLWDGGYDD